MHPHTQELLKVPRQTLPLLCGKVVVQEVVLGASIVVQNQSLGCHLVEHCRDVQVIVQECIGVWSGQGIRELVEVGPVILFLIVLFLECISQVMRDLVQRTQVGKTGVFCLVHVAVLEAQSHAIKEGLVDAFPQGEQPVEFTVLAQTHVENHRGWNANIFKVGRSNVWSHVRVGARFYVVGFQVDAPYFVFALHPVKDAALEVQLQFGLGPQQGCLSATVDEDTVVELAIVHDGAVCSLLRCCSFFILHEHVQTRNGVVKGGILDNCTMVFRLVFCLKGRISRSSISAIHRCHIPAYHLVPLGWFSDHCTEESIAWACFTGRLSFLNTTGSDILRS
mmetsp:Transcript_5511/g.34088  ORF Transcript_5511/g.34088 Transcript_5511/m.34088 type:complete len:336 (-) Transcript_5511:1495-2502(-)